MSSRKLSERQLKIIEVIRDYVGEYGYPPTIREIGDAVRISSTSVVSYNLDVLEHKGYLARDADVSRGLRLLEPDRREGMMSDLGSSMRVHSFAQESVAVPLLGVIAAGEPLPVPDNDLAVSSLDYLNVGTDIIKRPGAVYALRVKGDSMIEDLIADGDIVIMHFQQTAENGDTVAAWLKDEKATTLKRFYLESDKRRVRLQPRNPNLQPIYVDPNNIEIQGKVIGVIRQF